MALTDKLTAVADAIRAKNGGAEKMTLAQMPEKIANIQTGTDTGDATAEAGDLRKGKTAYAKGEKIVGTLEESGGGTSYVVGEPVTFTLPKWDAPNEGTTPLHGLQAEGYKIGANGVQLGLPSDSSVVNTQAMIEAALTIVRTEVAEPKPSEGECGRTYIDLSAVNAPSRDLTVAIFGLEEAERVTVTEPAIEGVTAPGVGEKPVTAITEGKQFTGTVTWSPEVSTFAASTVYTATITLTPKVGYKLDGVAANFFTVAGATSVSNEANSGVVTAVFPATKEATT